MDFGFLTDLDSTRYAHLRLRRLKEAIKDPRILDALMEELQVAGATAGALSTRQKLAAIERQIDGLRADEASTWHGVPAPEVLAAAIFGARARAGGAADGLFNEVARKEDLAAPIIQWLAVAGFAPYTQLPPGVTRVDLVAYHVAQFLSKPRIMGIELLNEPSALRDALERMTACAPYTHSMSLACTPATAAGILLAHASGPNVPHWVPTLLHDKLAASGFGLLLVEGDAVSEPLAPQVRKVDLQAVKTSMLRPR